MIDKRPLGEAATFLIGDVADLTGVTDHTLRAWEAVGLLTPHRSAGSVRQYTEDDIARVRLILRTLRTTKHSRRTIATMLHSGSLQPDAADYGPSAAPPHRRRSPSAIEPTASDHATSDDAARALRLTRILTSLARVNAAVASGRPLKDVLSVVCAETCAAFAVPDSLLWLIEPLGAGNPPETGNHGERWLSIAAGAGARAEAALDAPTPRAIPLQSAERVPPVQVLQQHRANIFNVLDVLPEAHPEIAALLPAAALLMVPLFSQHGETLGVLALREEHDINRFDATDCEHASLFTSKAALAIEATLLHEALRAARDEAERERSRWRAAVNHLPELVCLCDATGRFTYASPANERLLKRPANPTLAPEELPSHYGVFTPDGRPFPPEELVSARVLRERVPVKDVEALHRTPDGHEYLIVWAGAPMYAPDGSLLGVVSVGHDVTEQRRLERELAARAREHEALLDAMPEGVVRFDEHNQAKFLNKAMHTLFETDAQQAPFTASLEQRVTSFDLRDEHGQPLSPEHLPSARLLRGEPLGPDGMIDVRIQMPNGSVNQFSISGTTTYDSADHVTGAIVILRDVTLRRRQAERVDCLAAVARAAGGAPDPMGIEARAVRLLTALKEHGGLPLLTAGIYLEDSSSKTIYLAGHVTGDLAAEQTSGAGESPLDPLMRQVALSRGQPSWGTFVGDANYSFAARRPPDWLGVWIRDAWSKRQLRGWATAPIRSENHLLGVLVMTLTVPHLWDDEERTWFTACADAMAMGLENDRLFASERRHRERLRAVVEGVGDAITLVSADGQMLEHNAAARRLTGREPYIPYTGPLDVATAAYDLRNAEGEPITYEQTPVARALRGEKAREPYLRMRDGQGRDHVMDSTSTPVRDERQAIVGAVTIFRDITAETRRQDLARSVGRRMGASLDPDIEMRTLVDIVVESEIVRAAGIYRLLPDGEALTLKAVRVGPVAATSVDTGAFLVADAPLAARALEAETPWVARRDDPNSELLPRMALLPHLDPEIVAACMLPLIVDGRKLGVLAVGVADAAELDEGARGILTDVTHHAALLIDRAEHHQRLLAEALARRTP